MKMLDCDDDGYRMLSDAADTLIGAVEYVEHQMYGGRPQADRSGTIIVERKRPDGGVDCWTIAVAFQGERGPTH